MDVIKLFQGGFPMTIETLTFMQDAYTKPLKALASMSGENVILLGMNWNVSTAKFLEGWFVRGGEPIYFKESSIGDNTTIGIIEKTIQVPYNVDDDNNGELDLKDAYVSKYATMTFDSLESDEVLVETFSRDDLTRISNFRTLLPIGVVVLWFDPLNIPAGWRECNGVGGARDLRNAFIKGRGTDGGTVGNFYGARQKSLLVDNLPPHNHSIPSQNFSKKFGTGGARSDGGQDYLRTNDSDGTGSTKYFDTTATNTGNGAGSGMPFNIEPLHVIAIYIEYVGL